MKTVLTVLILSMAMFAATAQAKAPQQDPRWAVVRPYDAKLNSIAWCESRGNWYINTGNGYYGRLQFLVSTWRNVGGQGYPHQNSVMEQKYRAVLLIKRMGYSPWPNCA